MATIEEQITKLSDIDLYAPHAIPLLEENVNYQVSLLLNILTKKISFP